MKTWNRSYEGSFPADKSTLQLKYKVIDRQNVMKRLSKILLGPWETSMMKLLAKIVNGFSPLTVFTKVSSWMFGSVCLRGAFEMDKCAKCVQN